MIHWIEFTMQRLLLTYLLSVVAITSCQAQDVLELSLTSPGQTSYVTVDKGQNISLQCDMIFIDQVFPPITYMWREEGTFTDLTTAAVYNITADSDCDYQCRARAADLESRPVQVRGTICLTVRDPPVIATPDQPTITDDGVEYMIGYNDTCINNTFMGMVNFTCVVVSGRRPLTISWQVGGKDFTSDGHSMVVTINDTVSKLIIGVDTGASLDLDLNEYRCIANNSDGTDTIVSTLSRCETVPVIEDGITVAERPPSQGNIGGNYSNFIGEQVVINCTLIDGFPLPNISWFHMDTELIMLRNSSEIVIVVDHDTTGEYTCVATNMLGSDSATSFVDVVIVLYITRPGQRLSATVAKGKRIALDCSMIFTDQVLPIVRFVNGWREKGTFTSLSNKARYIVTADSDFSYQCTAFALALTFNSEFKLLQGSGIIDITVRGNSCKIKEISGKAKYRNNKRRLILTFLSNQQGQEASFVCQIDDQHFEPCTSPMKWTNLDLEPGEHSVTVNGSCVYNGVKTSSIAREFSFQVLN